VGACGEAKFGQICFSTRGVFAFVLRLQEHTRRMPRRDMARCPRPTAAREIGPFGGCLRVRKQGGPQSMISRGRRGSDQFEHERFRRGVENIAGLFRR